VEPCVPAVAAQFGLADVVSVHRPAHGGADVRVLTTTAGSFVLKRFQHPWQAELYDTVQRHLNARGVRQARLLPALDGSLVTHDGYSLQERLPGTVVMSPPAKQCQVVFGCLARYDVALEDLAIPPELDADGTIWARTASAEYLVADLPRLLERHLAAVDCTPVTRALAVLAEALPAVRRLPPQLVHGDVGPDNVLIDGDEAAVIDFTPYHQPVMFSLSAAFYWYFIYGRPDGADLAGIRSSLQSYAEFRPWRATELSVLPVMVLRESLRRLAVPLALADAGRERLGRATAARYEAVATVTAAMPVLAEASGR
jgi:Ser/Thr protein kinase RdoA (MazF antagonist)